MVGTFSILQHLLPKQLTRGEVQRLRNRARCIPGSDEATTRAFHALVEALDQVDAALARKELEDEKLVRRLLQEQEERRASSQTLMMDHIRRLDAVVKSPGEVDGTKLFGSALVPRPLREGINGEDPTDFIRHKGQPLVFTVPLDRLIELGVLTAVEETI